MRKKLYWMRKYKTTEVNFRDFQLLIEMGEEFVLNSEEKNTKLSEQATTRKLYKEDGTCDTYPIEESLLNNAKIEEQPIREIAEEFKLINDDD